MIFTLYLFLVGYIYNILFLAKYRKYNKNICSFVFKIAFRIVTNISSKTEGRTYKKEEFWEVIQFLRECKDNCQVNNVMSSKMTVQISYSVATGLF